MTQNQKAESSYSDSYDPGNEYHLYVAIPDVYIPYTITGGYGSYWKRC